MEASELRIGNHVTMLNFVTDKVTEIQIDYDDFENMIHQNHLLYQEIPLTQEWLLKFGFNKIMANLFNLKLDQNILYVSLSENLYSHIYISNGFNEIVLRRGKLNIHDLQNLYFSLTGEELTLKV